MSTRPRLSAAVRLVAALAAIASVPVGSRAVASDLGRLNPEAPPETAQFSFLIGDWECETKFMRPDGSGFVEGRARWSGRYILDGWAIQDFWIGYGQDGKESHGTNIRSFDPRTRKWDNRWLAAGALQWKVFEAEKVSDTMVMTGGGGEDARGPFIDRNVFYEISPDGWRWRKDRSWDGGRTWLEGIGHIEARRPEARWVATKGDD